MAQKWVRRLEVIIPEYIFLTPEERCHHINDIYIALKHLRESDKVIYDAIYSEPFFIELMMYVMLTQMCSYHTSSVSTLSCTYITKELKSELNKYYDK